MKIERITDKITLVCGDCMEYMTTLVDKSFQLAVVDPPYGINIGHGLGSGKKDYKMHKSWQFDAPTLPYFTELMRVSENQIIWGGNYFTDILPPCDNWIIWDKKNPNLTFSEAELAWCSIHRKVRIFPYCSTHRDRDGRFHPTQKPIALYLWLLEKYAKPENKILDTNLGSGSSAIAAYNLGHEFVGIEKDEQYFENAKERLQRHINSDSEMNLFSFHANGNI